MTEAQIKALESKLSQAIDARADLETDMAAQTGTYINFINKLSMACKGVNLELDNKLANLRAFTKKATNFEDIKIKMDEIINILKDIASNNDLQSDKLHVLLTQAGKGLQQSKGMDPGVRRQLREFINANDEKKDTVVQYIEPLNELVTFYRQVFESKANSESGILNDAQPNTQEPGLDLESVKPVVIRTLSDFKLSKECQDKLDQIIDQIKQSDSRIVVFEAILQVFELLAIDLKKERKTAKSFLSSISRALNTVKTKVNLTIETSSSSQAKHQELNAALNKHLSAMAEYVNKSDSVDDIKNEITQDLEVLGKLFEDKIIHEKSSSSALEKQLEEMKLRVSQLEEESKTFEVRLQKQLKRSMQDALTRLGNRAAFDEYFAQQMVRYNAKPFELAIVVIDLDDFKRINDTYGHTAGDKTLQVIANTLRKNFPKDIFVGRYGGEEFVIIFNNLDKDQLIEKLDSLRKKVALLPFSFKKNKVSITTSIGCTHVKSGDNVHQAFERADQALYQSKNEGKNRITYIE